MKKQSFFYILWVAVLFSVNTGCDSTTSNTTTGDEKTSVVETPPPPPIDSSALDNAAPLGFIMGVANLSDVKAKDSEMDYEGESWNGGKTYSSLGSAYNVDGLKRIIYIFDHNERLDAMQMTMDKRGYFEATHNSLKSKYNVVKQVIPFVGDSYVKYKKGKSVIELNAPHLSFEMSVYYATEAFDKAYTEKMQQEEEQNKQEQNSKF